MAQHYWRSHSCGSWCECVCCERGVSVSEASQRAALFTSYLADVESRLQSHCILGTDKISHPLLQTGQPHLELLDAWVQSPHQTRDSAAGIDLLKSKDMNVRLSVCTLNCIQNFKAFFIFKFHINRRSNGSKHFPSNLNKRLIIRPCVLYLKRSMGKFDCYANIFPLPLHYCCLLTGEEVFSLHMLHL